MQVTLLDEETGMNHEFLPIHVRMFYLRANKGAEHSMNQLLRSPVIQCNQRKAPILL